MSTQSLTANVCRPAKGNRCFHVRMLRAGFHYEKSMERSGNERPWKVLFGSPKISDFPLNCGCLADKHVAQFSRQCFISAHFHRFWNQSKLNLWRNSRESLVLWSRRSKEWRLEERDYSAFCHESFLITGADYQHLSACMVLMLRS